MNDEDDDDDDEIVTHQEIGTTITELRRKCRMKPCLSRIKKHSKINTLHAQVIETL
jgi:hypothetical protein